jgi:hypothetical protein
MLRWVALLSVVFVDSAPGAATFTIAPETIYQCSFGLGRATLTWSSALSTAQIRVGKPDGDAMTGFDGTSGAATTGMWVADGMKFYLVRQDGAVENVVTARVHCGGTPNTIETGLKSGSYLPLESGNTWVYRYSSRTVTSDYVTQTITGTEQLGEQTYFVLTGGSNPGSAAIARLRGDDQGRIWRFTGTTSAPKEELYLDPSGANPAAVLKNGAAGQAATALGVFPDGLNYTGGDSLLRETGVLVRGIGLARSTSTLLSGSSGGFVAGLELVEVRLAGGLRLAAPAAKLALATESPRLDVSNKKVTNCAVPCYFVACGLVGGADPDGTYKPCTQVRVEVSSPSAEALATLELRDASDRVLYTVSKSAAGSGESVLYLQVPLYAKPNEPHPPGAYRLVARLAAGSDTSTATLPLRID